MEEEDADDFFSLNLLRICSVGTLFCLRATCCGRTHSCAISSLTISTTVRSVTGGGVPAGGGAGVEGSE
jgi:hypothetical protein